MTRATKILIATPFAVILAMACIGMVMMPNVTKPAPSEFGYGPRTSASGNYTATIEETAKFPKRQMLTTTIVVKDKNGQPIDNLAIEFDGGMPEHGHGLPTKPSVSKENGAGQYRVNGLKFSMGGWWELKLRIANGVAKDSVVFNVEL